MKGIVLEINKEKSWKKTGKQNSIKIHAFAKNSKLS